jgi:hypothetical protein
MTKDEYLLKTYGEEIVTLSGRPTHWHTSTTAASAAWDVAMASRCSDCKSAQESQAPMFNMSWMFAKESAQ